jgi:predicted TPR repeat methyltransferase
MSADHDSASARRSKAAGDLCRRGNVCLAQQRYEEALISFDGALATHPDSIQALHCRGIALRNLNRPAEALASHNRALRIHSRDAQGLVLRAMALRELGRASEALASYDKAVTINPGCIEALHNRGTVLRDLGRFSDALASHDRALGIRPDDPIGLYNRGNALLDLQRHKDALASYDRALALRPEFVEALYNRGTALAALKQGAEALASYEKALILRPDYVAALHGRGIALRDLNRPVEALASHDRALAIRPESVEGHYNRGLILFGLMRYDEALAAYDKALALKPDYAEALTNRGTVLRLLGRGEEAVAAYRRARDAGAEPAQIAYLLAGLGAASPPIAAPKEFIISLFDQCAAGFEEHLAGRLKYRAPGLIYEGVKPLLCRESADVLDLGCGTGLVGAQFRPIAQALIGVDLSPNMLEQANKRQIYDRLFCSDVIEFLRRQTDKFDLMLAGDVLIYIGDLSGIFSGVAGALKGGGLFGFSIETSHAADFVLGRQLRYSHSTGYLQKLASENHLAVESVRSAPIRQEAGMDVDGCIVVMRRVA